MWRRWCGCSSPLLVIDEAVATARQHLPVGRPAEFLDAAHGLPPSSVRLNSSVVGDSVLAGSAACAERQIFELARACIGRSPYRRIAACGVRSRAGVESRKARRDALPTTAGERQLPLGARHCQERACGDVGRHSKWTPDTTRVFVFILLPRCLIIVDGN